MLRLVILLATIVLLAACGVPQDEHAKVLNELADTEDDLTALRSNHESLAETLVATEQALASAEEQRDRANDDLEAEREERGELQSDLDNLTADYNEIESQHQELSEAVDSLERLQANIETARTEISTLHEEIALLRSEREPLIVESYRNTFACTGSMEPAISCLDSATWLTNFTPEEIVIGSVISFTPPDDCDISAPQVAHRVIEVRVKSGAYEYRPKGDSNPSDDGCWVPSNRVNGYIIDLHQGTNPENAALRDLVIDTLADLNQAERRLDQRDSSMKGAERAYDAAVDELSAKTAAVQSALGTYESYVQQYCPNYTCPGGHYEQAQYLFGLYEDAYAAYESAANQAEIRYEDYSQAFNRYESAYRSYRSSLAEYESVLAEAMGAAGV